MGPPVFPDFSSLGDGFWTEWDTVIPLLWGVGVLVAVFFLGRGLLAMSRAKESGSPQERRSGLIEAACAAAGLGGLVALGTIIQIYWNLFF